MAEIGAVVVGLGIAGIVRVRDIGMVGGNIKLRGVVSRRPVELDNVESMTFDEALGRQDVNVLLICTEPGNHEEYVQKGLEANKHILVEYPVALSAAKAKELFQLAESKGLVLFEENIALLTEQHKAIKAKAATAEIKSASQSLTGKYNRWIQHFDASGLPFITGISNIQCMMDLFGDLTVTGGSFQQFENSYKAVGHLLTKNGKPVTLTLIREKDCARKKAYSLEFEDGDVLNHEKLMVGQNSKKGLFLQDLEIFLSFLPASKVSDEAKHRSIKSMELAEQIHSFFKM